MLTYMYKIHWVTSKESEPRRGLRKVCSWPNVVYTSVNIKKIMFIPYIYIYLNHLKE